MGVGQPGLGTHLLGQQAQALALLQEDGYVLLHECGAW
jgi:hypothetical protein